MFVYTVVHQNECLRSFKRNFLCHIFMWIPTGYQEASQCLHVYTQRTPPSVGASKEIPKELLRPLVLSNLSAGKHCARKARRQWVWGKCCVIPVDHSAPCNPGSWDLGQPNLMEWEVLWEPGSFCGRSYVPAIRDMWVSVLPWYRQHMVQGHLTWTQKEVDGPLHGTTTKKRFCHAPWGRLGRGSQKIIILWQCLWTQQIYRTLGRKVS